MASKIRNHSERRAAQQDPAASEIEVEIVVDDHVTSPLEFEAIRRAVDAAARDQGFGRGEVGVRLTDDPTIHELNRAHLGHDYPTDVISFDYDSADSRIEGELVVSIETAMDRAAELAWPVNHELLLYIVHGTLHIAGLDDLNDEDRAVMRSAEQRVMQSIGIKRVASEAPVRDDGAAESPNLQDSERPASSTRSPEEPSSNSEAQA